MFLLKRRIRVRHNLGGRSYYFPPLSQKENTMRTNTPRYLQPNRWSLYFAYLGACSRGASDFIHKLSCYDLYREAALHTAWPATSPNDKLWYLCRIGLGPFDHPYRKAITRSFAPLLRTVSQGAIAPLVDNYLQDVYASADDMWQDLHYLLRKQSLPASNNPRACELLEHLLEQEEDQRNGWTRVLPRYPDLLEIRWLVLALCQEHLCSHIYAARLLSYMPECSWPAPPELTKAYIHARLNAEFPELPCAHDKNVLRYQQEAFGRLLPGTTRQPVSTPTTLLPSAAGALHGPRVVQGREQW